MNRLLYFETHSDVLKAITREKQLKGWRREKKIALIKSMNPFLERPSKRVVESKFSLIRIRKYIEGRLV